MELRLRIDEDCLKHGIHVSHTTMDAVDTFVVV